MLKTLSHVAMSLLLLACSQQTQECYDLVSQDGFDVVRWRSNTGNSTVFGHVNSEGYFAVNTAVGSREVGINISIDGTGFGRPRLYNKGDEYPYLDCSDAIVTINGIAIRPSNKGACANGVDREQMPDIQVMTVYFQLPQPAINTLKVTLPQLRKRDAPRYSVITADYKTKSFPPEGGGFR
jgi:hypothetical protein